jgi:hypothetical protein
MAGSLCSGTLTLLDTGNAYSGAAIIRQLVEVEYLSWAFMDDEEEAASWVRERLARWQPRHLRERSKGRFRGTDYSNHCEIGGHPTASGARALIQSTRPSVAHLQLWECAVHASSAWHYLLGAVKLTNLSTLVASGDQTGLVLQVAEAEKDWRTTDPMFRVGPTIPAFDVT